MHAGREFMERFWYHVKKLVNAHTDNQENPHRVTKKQIGLGSVPNVSTNDQAPTFTVVNEDTALTSGEKLSTLLGKVARTVLSVISLKEEVSRLNGKLGNMIYVTLSGGPREPISEIVKYHIDNENIPIDKLFIGELHAGSNRTIIGYLYNIKGDGLYGSCMIIGHKSTVSAIVTINAGVINEYPLF